ncbi:hypothetical protein ETB97_004861 [Aspergillus alliaceus]|uniref:PNPLA domain-containing protein n=1 Tax=Petromyces alliaceus TaxID=209559 RepID=A0A8H6A1B8_PETAA|nr:hypothetical protein ETB97_004861 [Aspergillus burnettii]
MAACQESGSHRAPVFLRSYTSDSDPPHPDPAGIKVWQAARAALAAPGYFAPMKVGKVKLVDGGLLANNQGLSEYGLQRKADCVLSIGTGMAPSVAVSQPGLTFNDAIRGFAALATNTESTQLPFGGLINAFAPRPGTEKYWRLKVAKEATEESEWMRIWNNIRGRSSELTLNDFADPWALDDVKAIKELEKWTEEYVRA